MGDLDRRQLLIYAALAVLIAIAAVRLLDLGGGSSGGGAPPPVALDGAGGAPRAPGRQGPAGGRRLYVHVAGAVRRPGLQRVRPGARLAVAVERAGGTTRRADLAGVNLAAPVRDGQQVIVPERGAVGAAAAAGGGKGSAAGSGAPGAPISLSSATQEQLETLDGIGPALARAVLAYRDAHGGFRSVEELQEVEGIGEKRFAALRGAVQP